ncbi:MAG: hypothetical protein HYY16_19860 [Planctomycetes bacterium]|nr:hypothetical protein [Planctomycetota bacterium]
MPKGLGWIFTAGAAAGAVAVWILSDGAWGRQEEHAIVGQDLQRADAPCLFLLPIRGEARGRLAVPQEVCEAVAQGDVLFLSVRRIPLLQADLERYAIIRSGTAIRTWEEGWPFYGLALAVAALAGGALLAALAYGANAVFRLRAPAE